MDRTRHSAWARLDEAFGSGGGTVKADRDTLEALAQVVSVAVDSGKLSPGLSSWVGPLIDTLTRAAEKGMAATIHRPPGVRDWKRSASAQQSADAQSPAPSGPGHEPTDDLGKPKPAAVDLGDPGDEYSGWPDDWVPPPKAPSDAFPNAKTKSAGPTDHVPPPKPGAGGDIKVMTRREKPAAGEDELTTQLKNIMKQKRQKRPSKKKEKA